MRNNRPG